MRSIKVTLFIFLLAILLTGCHSKEKTELTGKEKAFNYCIGFINHSSFDNKDDIDTSKVTYRNATEDTWKSVFNEEGKIDDNLIDTTDWIVTIGDTNTFDYVFLVCDSDTGKVIGLIPTD